jgi:stage III sporulation protein AE
MKKMMKFSIVVFLLVVAAVLLGVVVLGADVEGGQAEALRLGELEEAAPEGAREVLGSVEVMDALKPEGLVGRVLEAAGGGFRGAVKQALGSVTVMVAAAALCGVAGAAFGEAGGGHAELAAVLAVAAASVGSVRSFIAVGAQTLDELDAFSKTLIPTLAAAAAGSGAAASAAAKHAATMLFVNLAITLSRKAVMPLIYAHVAAGIADAAAGGGAARGVADFTMWLARTVMTATVFAFIAYLTLVGAASGPGDELAMRAAKTAISALPVVGSIAAEAAGAVVSGAAVLRNAVGIFGALAVAAMCVLPFVRLGAHYLIYKAAGSLAGVFAGGRVARLIGDVGAAFGMTLGMAGMSAVMVFVSIISMTRAVA